MSDLRHFLIPSVLVLILGIGAAVAVAAGETTGTNIACATATAIPPDHTVGVDGSDVHTITGSATTATDCETQSYTIPTNTTTETVPPVTTTATETATTTETTIATTTITTPPVTITTTTTTPPPSPTMLVSIDGWGGGDAAGQVALGGAVRVDMSRMNPTQFWQLGAKAIMLVPGCNSACGGTSQGYATSGVSAINATTWANNAVSKYGSQCAGSTTDCPAVEVLNEPGGSWFWGSSAMSQTNANAYATLLKTTYNAFHSTYGSNAPKILASYDGGDDSSTTWGQRVWANTVGITVNNYVDGVTAHPYGGPANPSVSALGNRAQVTTANTATGKPVWVTEIGWPSDCTTGCPTTANATGDSMQWSQAQQATNIYNFIGWARATGYVAAVSIYEYRDDSTTAAYGVETSSGTHKASYAAMQDAVRAQACTTCG